MPRNSVNRCQANELTPHAFIRLPQSPLHAWNMRQLTLVVQRAQKCNTASWRKCMRRKAFQGHQTGSYWWNCSTDNLPAPLEKEIQTKSPSNTPNHGLYEENPSSKSQINSALNLTKKPLLTYYLCAEKSREEITLRSASTLRKKRKQFTSHGSEPFAPNKDDSQYTGYKAGAVQAKTYFYSIIKKKIKTYTSVNEHIEKISLYDELFPEESIQRKNRAQMKKAVDKIEKLPMFEWSKDIKTLKKAKKKTRVVALSREKPSIDNQEELIVLSLNACSSTLEQSDFFRLGLKGKYISAWANGIIKVIPDRDEASLCFKGSYLILFSSRFAAEAYHNQVTQLHQLSKNHKKLAPYLLPTPSGYSQDSEETENILQNFSLIPAYGRLSLNFLNYPYGKRINETLKNGGLIASLSRRTKTENLVLFSLDVGIISMQELCDFIDNDGKRRNLHWKLAGRHRGIIDLNLERNLINTETADPESTDTSNSESTDTVDFESTDTVDSESTDMADSECTDTTDSESKKRINSKPSRFLLPFISQYEARRFVRECHRRPFPLPQKMADAYFSTINAEILW